MLIVSTFPTPIGWFEVEYDEHFVYRAAFNHSGLEKPHQNDFGAFIKNELDAYFQNPQYHFQLPLKPLGSCYQQRVWNSLLVIPAGRTMTYGELATQLQSSPRAIGQACRTNPVTLFIPCHRIVGKNNLGGYMGKEDALSYKLGLLQHENARCID